MMLLQGLASIMAKTNPSLFAALMIASGIAPTNRPSPATSGHIFQGVCTLVVMPLITMANVVVDGESASMPTPKRFPLTSGRRYYRLDDYRTHWRKCHKDQEWVNPQARDRFMYLWEEHCEQRNKRQFLTTSSFFQQAPGLALPQVPSMDATSSPAPLPPAADTSAVPTRLVQVAPQVVLVENSLGLFGQDSFALATPLPDANIPFSVLPPSAYNYPAASFAFPNASDYMGYRRFTHIDTGFSSQSSSASTPSVPIPPTEDAFASIGASDQLQARLEPYGSLAPDFQATNEDWSKWLADL